MLVEDYAARFIDCQQRSGAEICVAHDGHRLQPVHALIRVDLLPRLNTFLAGGERKIDRWYSLHDCTRADFSNCPDMFRNINTTQDREALQAKP